MRKTAKHNILYVIAGMSAIFLLVGLCFGIICPTKIIPLNVMNLFYNGYTMAGALIDPGPSTIIRSILDMYGIDWLYFIIVVVSSLQLIAGIVMIVTLACHYFFSCRGKRLLTTVSVISVAFNILYAILGIICFSIFVNSSIADIITDMYGISQSAAESLYGDLDFTTVCWIPALITALLFLSYCIANTFVPDDLVFLHRAGNHIPPAPRRTGSYAEYDNTADTRSDTETAAADGTDVSEDEKIRLLTKYKELLDSGTITQSDYDAKKKKLME